MCFPLERSRTFNTAQIEVCILSRVYILQYEYLQCITYIFIKGMRYLNATLLKKQRNVFNRVRSHAHSVYVSLCKLYM